jgi:hypothetical protein
MLRVLAMLILISSVALAGQENVIKGIERLEWGKGQDCTYIGALTALAHYVGDKDVTYDFLMGVSGQAFRVQKWEEGWCPSAGDSGCGFNCCETAPKTLGYDIKWLGWYEGKSEAEKFKAMGKPLMESIDTGNPGISLDADYGLVVGYQDGGKKFLYRSYFDKEGEYTAKGLPWTASVYRGKGERPDRKKMVLQSLDYALEMANKDQYGDYFSGFKAYDEWIGALVDEPAFKKMSAEDVKGAAHANAFCYASLIDARSAAARYIGSVKDDLGPEAAPHLLAAAETYDSIAQKLRKGEVVYSWEVGKKPWTPEMRRSEAVLLKSAASMEKQAIAELKQARALAK